MSASDRTKLVLFCPLPPVPPDGEPYIATCGMEYVESAPTLTELLCVLMEVAGTDGNDDVCIWRGSRAVCVRLADGAVLLMTDGQHWHPIPPLPRAYPMPGEAGLCPNGLHPIGSFGCRGDETAAELLDMAALSDCTGENPATPRREANGIEEYDPLGSDGEAPF